MAGLKQIKRRVKSVRNTRKITSAMKLVAAAKLRRAQDAVTNSREYADSINQLLSQLVSAGQDADFSHALMASREVKSIALMVVGGNRGLCGGYNTNMNKAVDAFFRDQRAENPKMNISGILLGRKPAEHFRGASHPIGESHEDLAEDPARWPLEEICEAVKNQFVSGKVDAVYLAYTRFHSPISVRPCIEQLLPFDALVQQTGAQTESASEDHDTAGDGTAANSASAGLTIFEPSVQAVFAAVIPRIFRTKVLQACLDSKASEHGCRMTAMDSATKNAGELAQKLQLQHNRMRQAEITNQLLDIVGGAEALN